MKTNTDSCQLNLKKAHKPFSKDQAKEKCSTSKSVQFVQQGKTSFVTIQDTPVLVVFP